MRLVNAHLTIKQNNMKKHFTTLLDQVTPANDEQKEFVSTILGFWTFLFALIGISYSLLNLMP